MAYVLLLEDDEDLRFGLAGILTAAGHDVAEAWEGAAALKSASGRRPDLVVSDLVMDGMEGIATIIKFKKDFAGMPVLAISGNAMYLANSTRLGADAALLKPFTRDQFLTVIGALLGSD